MKDLKVSLCSETENAKINAFARQSLWPTITVCIYTATCGNAMYNVNIVYSYNFYSFILDDWFIFIVLSHLSKFVFREKSLPFSLLFSLQHFNYVFVIIALKPWAKFQINLLYKMPKADQ